MSFRVVPCRRYFLPMAFTLIVLVVIFSFLHMYTISKQRVIHSESYSPLLLESLCARAKHEKFMTYHTQWGMGNQAKFLSYAAAMAVAINRTLVVPPLLPHWSRCGILGSHPKDWSNIIDPIAQFECFDQLTQKAFSSWFDVYDFSDLNRWPKTVDYKNFRIMQKFCLKHDDTVERDSSLDSDQESRDLVFQSEENDTKRFKTNKNYEFGGFSLSISSSEKSKEESELSNLQGEFQGKSLERVSQDSSTTRFLDDEKDTFEKVLEERGYDRNSENQGKLISLRFKFSRTEQFPNKIGSENSLPKEPSAYRNLIIRPPYSNDLIESLKRETNSSSCRNVVHFTTFCCKLATPFLKSLAKKRLLWKKKLNAALAAWGKALVQNLKIQHCLHLRLGDPCAPSNETKCGNDGFFYEKSFTTIDHAKTHMSIYPDHVYYISTDAQGEMFKILKEELVHKVEVYYGDSIQKEYELLKQNLGRHVPEQVRDLALCACVKRIRGLPQSSTFFEMMAESVC